MKFLRNFLIFLFFVYNLVGFNLWGSNVCSVKWNPTKDLLAAGGDNSLTNGPVQIYSFARAANALTYTYSRTFGTTVNTTAWSMDGNFLAVGGIAPSFPSHSQELQLYRLRSDNSLTGSIVGGVDIGSDTSSVTCIDWSISPTFFIAISCYLPTSGNELQLYSFRSQAASLTLTDSRNYANSDYGFAVKFDPTTNYLALGGKNPITKYELQIYKFDPTAASGKIIGGSPFAYTTTATSSFCHAEIRGIAWSPDGRYLAVGGGSSGDGYDLKIYRFFTDQSLSQQQKLFLVDFKDLGTSAVVYSVDWSSVGNYISVGVTNPTTYELQVYSFDVASETLSSAPVAKYDNSNNIWSANWTADSRYLAFGDTGGNIKTFWSYYKGLGLYRYDGTTYNVYNYNPIVLRNGDNATGKVGFAGGVTVAYDAGAKLNTNLPISNYLDLQTTGSMILNGDLILDSNLSFSNGGIIDGGRKTLFLDGDIQIPAGAVIEFAGNIVVDAQGHNLVLGKYSQLLVDGGVTVTFKNMTIKNMLNTINIPPIRCMDWYSKACFDNVTFALNDDWAFRNGQFFIHNDVEFTGTSKFSYRSVRPSYITSDANLLFDSNTTFEFYPSTTDNSLIKMVDKTSAIIFDGSTLQSTHTGIRLTKGSLYFDNKVTLSSVDNTVNNRLELVYTTDEAESSRSASWSPDGRYLIVGNLGQVNRLYKLVGSTLTSVGATVETDNTTSVAWNPNGRYIAVGNSNQVSRLYRVEGEKLILVDSTSISTDNIASVAWSPNGRYLAVGVYANPNRLYRLDGEKLTLVFSTNETDQTYSVAWNPNGRYLAVGNNNGTSNRLYRLDGETLTLLSITYGASDNTRFGLDWSPDGQYLAVGNEGQANRLYRFVGETLSLIGSTAETDNTMSVAWSPDGHYLAVGNDNNQVNRLYRFDGINLTLIYSTTQTDNTYYVLWTPDGMYLAVANYPTQVNRLYKSVYSFDTSPQGFSDSIIFGNSAFGASQDLDVYLLGAARVGIYGKVWQDSVSSGLNFQSRDSYISLNSYDSKFKITNASSVQSLKKTQIIKGSAPNTLFLQDNQIWQTSSDQFAPEETFEFMDDFIIPDGQLIKLQTNITIDGNGHDLILGKYSQLLVDGGVTVTFKNMTIKNRLNTISCPPIRCMDWYSRACFDNVTFAFNDDWAFRNGQIFVHNDVEFTGTSKFSYRSVRPSYITQHSNLIFNPNTIFEFYPSSTNNQLINTIDKTSAIIFDGSMLQTTNTGIRLTRGSLYFDNKVTLSSVADYALVFPFGELTTKDFVSSVNAVAWSPDGKYLAVGGNNSTTDLIVYELNGSTLTQKDTKNFDIDVNAVNWSPDGKYLAVGGNNLTADLIVYEWNGSTLTQKDTKDFGTEVSSVNWSPDGRYLAAGGYNSTTDLVVYEWNGSTLTQKDTKDFDSRVNSVNWSPDGKYLAVGGSNLTADLIVYEWNGSTLTQKDTKDFNLAYSVNWSPDGKYLAVGGNNSTTDLVVYEWIGSTLSQKDAKDFSTNVVSVNWSPDGRYLAAGGNNSTTDLIVYEWNGSVLTQKDTKNFNAGVASVNWSPDERLLAVGGTNLSADLVVYSANNIYDTSPQSFSNGIVFGNSAIGSSHDLDVYLLGAARVGIYGKVWQDSVNGELNFQSHDSYVSLDRFDSKFKISNLESVKNWKKFQIIKSSQDNTFLLQNNQVWGAMTDQFAPEETFEFINNLIIPDNTLITFSSNTVIDGQNFDLCLGKRAQLFLDNGVTLTIKNLNIKNTLNTNSTPIIRGLGATSRLCLDNVNFYLNNDFIFNVGQIFFHNDVIFTGTSKFSYRSISPSYIVSNANLIFSPYTTFEYYPGSGDNSLIKMLNKTSSIIFDGSTLQTTHTGIRLTKGSVYFDNNVTLSSFMVINPEQPFSNGIIFGNSSLGSAYDVDIYLLGRANIKIAGRVWFDDIN